MVTDRTALPLAAEVTAGQCHESTRVESVMNAVRVPQPVGRPRTRPYRLAGDKAYSIPRIRQWLRNHAIQAVIPQKTNEREWHRGRPLQFDREAYAGRNVVERCINWLKECRRIGTRFEKLAVNFMAMVKLAFIQRYLRVLFSDRP
jgi:transposase